MQVFPQVIPDHYHRGEVLGRSDAQLSTYSTKAVHQAQLDIRVDELHDGHTQMQLKTVHSSLSSPMSDNSIP